MRMILFAFLVMLAASQPTAAQSGDYRPAGNTDKVSVHFGIVKGKTASVDELLEKPELVVVNADQPSGDRRFRVVSFTLSMLQNGIYETLASKDALAGLHTVTVEDPLTGDQRTLISDSNSTPPDLSLQGNQLAPAQIGRLRALRPGDKVFFDNIKAVGPDGAIRRLSSVQVMIK